MSAPVANCLGCVGFSSYVRASTTAPACETYGVAIDAAGRVVDVLDSTGAPVSEPIRTCYMQALSNQTFPCLAGENVWYECYDVLR